MEQQPHHVVSEYRRVKPVLFVCDDDVEQLASYCTKLQEKYEVEGVLVADCNKTYDALKKGADAKDWTQIAEDYHVLPSVFGHVRHIIGSREELYALLAARKPDFVLSDFQMRRIQGPLSGIDVMHAVAELLPNTLRAIHTGSGSAQPIPVRELHKHEFEDRMELVKAMRRDGFKVFPKTPYHKNFNPKPIETYFTQAREASTLLP